MGQDYASQGRDAHTQQRLFAQSMCVCVDSYNIKAGERHICKGVYGVYGVYASKLAS